jgi:hypothetical protein
VRRAVLWVYGLATLAPTAGAVMALRLLRMTAGRSGRN